MKQLPRAESGPCRGLVIALAWAGVQLGCSDSSLETGDRGDTSGDTDTLDPSAATQGTAGDPEPAATSADESVTTAEPEPSTDSDDTGTGGPPSDFIVEPDGGPSNIQCSVWSQDCVAGQKCVPYAIDARTWDSTKCVEVSGNPAAPGDECSVEGGTRHSGIDNCDKASMCWDVEEDTLAGTCAGFCSGSPDNPTCEDPQTTCIIMNSGVITLCLSICDPLLVECADDQGCYLVGGVGIPFCMANRSAPDGGNYGDPCEFLNSCNPGLWCAQPTAVPGCETARGCCTNFCDLAEENPNNACGGVAEGQVCQPLYADGNAPPGLESVGTCALPV